MDTEYVLLTEQDEIWAAMLLQVLKDNQIPCTTLPVHGAGVVLKTGMQERLRIFVPKDQKEKAEEYLHELFPSGNA